MTISSPVGSVNTYTFTLTDTLLNGVSLGIGPLTSWTLPRHDGDIRIAAVGGAGGRYTGQSASAGHGGTVRGYYTASNGAAVGLAIGGQGGHQAAGGTAGTSSYGPGGAAGASNGGGDGGGGGGAGGAGGAGTPNATSPPVGGAGGIGVQSSITGTALWYAGGGGGQGLQTSGSGASGGVGGSGVGGGGAYSNNNSTWTAGTPPTANRGGGGGGGQGSPTTAHDGADGIVIIRYII